ncbi:hypothetical protein L873DRAFT_1867021 [Choiromyces venosus 120613-1]|uniref:Uncharacterized protein n=1 Tax=Choiromyces venosus 120613-1 TaxID=1336337 RepID=A0A3N4J3F5_9PEZI|nr:hypothetical protein L873DRAFT_1867021 [Choiromyces venosus 120613-1]
MVSTVGDLSLINGFRLSVFDPCVLINQCGNLFVTIYIDDITIFCSKHSQKEATVALLNWSLR